MGPLSARPEIILPPAIARAGATASGLLVPADTVESEPAELNFVHTFVTWEELTGKNVGRAAHSPASRNRAASAAALHGRDRGDVGLGSEGELVFG